MTKFSCNVGEKKTKRSKRLSCIGFCTKLYRILAVSKKTVFLVPYRELISKTNSWKAPKRAQLVINVLFPKHLSEKKRKEFGLMKLSRQKQIFGLLGIVEIRSPSHFLLTFLLKTVNFANMKCFGLHLENETKFQKSPVPFLSSRLLLHVSKLNLSMMFSEKGQLVGGRGLLTHFRVF